MVAFFTPPPLMKSALVSTFIGITALSQATGTVVWPAGTQAGDLALLIMAGNSWPVPAGWTYIAGDLVGPSSPSASGFAFKVLDAGDISSPPSETVPSNGAYYFAVYRGGTTLTKKSTAASTAATVSVPGFAKAATSRLVLAVGHDRDPGTAPTPPTGFNFRATAASTYFMHGVYDLAAAAYTDNSAVVFNLVSPGNPYAGRGTLLEIT